MSRKKPKKTDAPVRVDFTQSPFYREVKDLSSSELVYRLQRASGDLVQLEQRIEVFTERARAARESAAELRVDYSILTAIIESRR